MAEFNEDFEGAADGVGATTLTTAFFGSTNPASTMTHSSLRSIMGSKSLRIVNPAAIQQLYNVYTTPRTVMYRRVYWYAADVTSGAAIMTVQTGGTLNSSNVRIAAGGPIQLRDTLVVTATSAITAVVGQWYRFEQFVDTAAGTHTLRIFTGANLHGTTPDDTISGSVGVGTFDRTALGVNAAGTIDWFFDAYVDNQSGWVGPANIGGGRLLLEDASGYYLLEDGLGRLITEDFVTTQLLATDDFNRPDGALGNNWQSTTAAMTIGSNQVVATSAQSVARWNVDTQSDNQFSEIIYTGSGLGIGPAVALPPLGSTFTSTGDFYFFRETSTGGIVLGQKLAGSATVTALATSAVDMVAGDIARLDYVSGVLTAKINGVTVLTNTPASPIIGQRGVGIAHNNAGQVGVMLLDNWAGGDFAAAPINLSNFFAVL